MISLETNKPDKLDMTETPTEKIDNLGMYLFMTMMTMAGFAGGLLAALLCKLGRLLAKVGRLILSGLKSLGSLLASPFMRYKKLINVSKAEVSRAKSEKGPLGAFFSSFKIAGRVILGKRGLAVTICNYALPVLSCIFLFNIVSYANSMTYALRLSINGDFVGYIDEENVFTDAEKMVQQRINFMDGNTESVSFDPSYELEMVGYGSTLTKYQLADKMLSSLDAQIEYGYGMYIGNAFYGVIPDKEKIEATLDSLLDVYRTDSPNETVAFESSITFEPGLYLSESMVTEDSIIKLITTKKQVAAYYTAVEGDSPYLIADKLDMTMSEVEALNPGFSEYTSVFVGDKFLINQEEPFLAVTVTRLEVFDEYTPYETEYYDDSSRYIGAQVTTRDGEYGVDRVTANISYINGVEVRRKELTRMTVSEPVSKLVAKGTKALPSKLPASIQDVEIGQMYWPVGGYDGGAISETMYGYGGYYGHSGVDIAANYGTPIYAAESGKVILAQWYYDYGNAVIIQHNNGIKTLYAHCSYLHVSAGEYVTQGQQIADVGATGRAYGNHLHFEVRVNDVCVYPLTYLPWHKRQPGCVEY